MGSCCSSCWNCLFSCCCNKEEKEKEEMRKMFAELYYCPPNKDKVINASSPSNIPTNNITAVYEINKDDVQVDNAIIERNGYKLLERVGKGSSGVVFKAEKISDSKVIACKRVDIELRKDTTDKIRFDVKNELFIIQKTKHPNIVRVYDHFMIKRPKTQSVYIIMDFVEYGLTKFMCGLKMGCEEPIAQQMFAQMVSAVRYMHRKGIAHRDIKMDNILMDNSLNILVTDFGMSLVAYRPSKGGIILKHSVTGTAPYMAPEIVRCLKDHSVPYDPFMADIWALGVILCCMINKSYPFSFNQTVISRLKHMKHKKFPIINIKYTPNNLSEDYIDIQKRLLEFDVRNRITSERLAKHPWISDQIKLIKEE